MKGKLKLPPLKPSIQKHFYLQQSTVEKMVDAVYKHDITQVYFIEALISHFDALPKDKQHVILYGSE